AHHDAGAHHPCGQRALGACLVVSHHVEGGADRASPGLPDRAHLRMCGLVANLAAQVVADAVRHFAARACALRQAAVIAPDESGAVAGHQGGGHLLFRTGTAHGRQSMNAPITSAATCGTMALPKARTAPIRLYQCSSSCAAAPCPTVRRTAIRPETP